MISAPTKAHPKPNLHDQACRPSARRVEKILQPRLPLEWTGTPAGFMLSCMGQTNQTGSCSRCGRAIGLALLPEPGMRCGPQCIGYEKSDPLKSRLVTGWLNGKLGRPGRTIIRPK
jgi:hypothetical protein